VPVTLSRPNTQLATSAAAAVRYLPIDSAKSFGGVLLDRLKHELLGPFEAVHFTYKEHIRCIEDAHKGTELELRFHEDLLVYAGKYYGDFEICGGQCLDYKNLVPEFFASLDLITGLAESIVRSSGSSTFSTAVVRGSRL